jgi:hypothetical protein
MGENTRAAGLFQVQINDVGGAAQIEWSKLSSWREWAHLSEGCYMLRSNVTDWTPEELWRAYIQLTEAEAAFRIHKSDLQIRPVWHQRADRVQAHILVCFLAYVLWKTLGQLSKMAGLGDEPRRILRALRAVDGGYCPSHPEWDHHSQEMRFAAHRSSGNPPTPPRAQASGAGENYPFVVETRACQH